jgi:hypothetical protein
MQRIFLRILAIALLTSPVAYGQSLGDVARENREQKAEDQSAASPKVITNKDLPKDPDANQQAPQSQPAADAAASNQAAEHRLADRRLADRREAYRAQQRMAERRAAEQWKRQILAQKEKVAALQARVDEINASIRASYGTVQYDQPYNLSQARQMRRVAQVQQQLDQQKMRLDQMQEAARRAGMHSAVYDP